MKKFYSSGEIKDFVKKLKKSILSNSHFGFDLDGHPVIIWNTRGYAEIDALLDKFIKENLV